MMHCVKMRFRFEFWHILCLFEEVLLNLSYETVIESDYCIYLLRFRSRGYCFSWEPE